MGRLSEYINGVSGKRSVYMDDRSGDVVVSGVNENIEMLNSIITKDASMERQLRSIISKALKKARSNVSKDAKAYLENDPRGAYKAVKHSVYKKLFGGNISILQKRRRSAPTTYVRPKADRTGKRGGNRVPASERTKQVNSYAGSDRGFVLRFINAGTTKRMTRLGNRGKIPASNWFSHVAPWQMDMAANIVSDAIEELIATKTK